MAGLDVYALTVIALFLKMFAVAAVQGRYRLKHKRFTKAEDAAYWGDGAVADSDHPIVVRAQRTLRNDLENIPIFLFLAWVYIAVEAWPGGALLYFGLFVGSRIVHTAAYLRPTQPLRNRAYLCGIAICLVLSGHIAFEVATGG